MICPIIKSNDDSHLIMQAFFCAIVNTFRNIFVNTINDIFWLFSSNMSKKIENKKYNQEDEDYVKQIIHIDNTEYYQYIEEHIKKYKTLIIRTFLRNRNYHALDCAMKYGIDKQDMLSGINYILTISQDDAEHLIDRYY